MSLLNPVPEEDLRLDERTEHRTLSIEDAQAHRLAPGDLCICIDDPDLGTDATVGVVVNSAANDEHSVEVKFGGEPIRTFSRTRLLWLGAVG